MKQTDLTVLTLLFNSAAWAGLARVAEATPVLPTVFNVLAIASLAVAGGIALQGPKGGR